MSSIVNTLLRLTASPMETLRLGECLGSLIEAPTVISLNAPLGGGKTWFSKGVARGVGRHEYDAVTSPAYNLVHEYVSTDRSVPKIYHIDFYRLDEMGHEDLQMFEEYLYDDEAVSLVEWGDKFLPSLFDSYVSVKISYGPGDAPETRLLEFALVGHSSAYENLLSRFEQTC
jgi:tRNA threonylcarbamoyladenosine biosynthesis protein TsaE